MKMVDLTLTQQVTFNDINMAPHFTDTVSKGDSFRFNGVVFGCWNRNTIKSLERKGLVEVLPTRSDEICVLVEAR
jgi:hypothetical protein